MVNRILATLLLGLMLVGMVAVPAVATEGGSDFTEYEDIRQNASSVSEQFLAPDAEDAERPGFFDWMIFPLAAAGIVITLLIVVRYLMFQPRFAREADARSQR